MKVIDCYPVCTTGKGSWHVFDAMADYFKNPMMTTKDRT